MSGIAHCLSREPGPRYTLPVTRTALGDGTALVTNPNGVLLAVEHTLPGGVWISVYVLGAERLRILYTGQEVAA